MLSFVLLSKAVLARDADRMEPLLASTSASSPGAAKGATVAVSVKTSDPLVGETWYAPDILVTNLSESPITVTGVELSTRGVTYANRPRQLGSYPLSH